MQKTLLLILVCLLSALGLRAQQSGVGSFLSDNGKKYLSANQFDAIYVESLFIGPNAEWEINGQVDLYVKNIWIAPTAQLSGTGEINIHSPADNPFYQNWKAQPTMIDGNNGNFIAVKLVLQNKDGLKLTNISGRDYEKTSYPKAEKAAALRIGDRIELRVDGANIFLNGNDLELDVHAQLLSANQNRMVVTGNSTKGHLIKNFATPTTSFLFPVGKEIGDYSPARLTPSMTSSKVYVSVTDYLASGLQFKDETIGMDRVWSIFADKAMKMDYTLIHDMSSNGVAFVDPKARVVQDADGGNWIGDVTVFNEDATFSSTMSTHTRKDIATKTVRTLSGTWFTKMVYADPKAVDDYAVLDFGTSKTIQVLDNDVAGSAVILRNSVVVTLSPAHGVARVVNGAIEYTASFGFHGVDQFVYEITDRNGSKSTASVYVTVLPKQLFIPNIITPNGDGLNDRFVIQGWEEYDQIDLTILNRWGNEEYQNSYYQNEWDGHGLSEGTYFYIIKAHKGAETRVFRGNVLINRTLSY